MSSNDRTSSPSRDCKGGPSGDAVQGVASTAGLKDDATIASIFQAIDTLENVFGFSGEAAQQAIEAVGTDVTAAYNYILDKGLAKDGGGPIVPISDCPHVEHHLCLSPGDLPSPHSLCGYSGQWTRTGSAKGELKKMALAQRRKIGCVCSVVL